MFVKGASHAWWFDYTFEGRRKTISFGTHPATTMALARKKAEAARIAQIGASNTADPLYDAKVKVLGEYIRHHVKEEEGELFPACRKTEMNLEEIGGRLEKRKAELMRKLNPKQR